jgi:FHS family Na+ dependent glucose MFS transporter 1
MEATIAKVWAWLKKESTILTLTYCSAFLCLGLLLAGLGPCLPTLGRNTNQPDDHLGGTVTSRALGYLLGSTTGPIFHKLPGNKMVAISLCFTSLVCFLVPNLTNFYWLCVLFFFQGVSMGMLDTGCNLMTLWLQKENPDPYIQSLHAAFAVGAVISPAILKGVLANHSPINWVWYGIGIAFLPAIALLVYFPSPSEPVHEEESKENDDMFKFSWQDPLNVDYKPYLAVLGTSLFLLCYVGGEVATGSFMTTFALRRKLTTEDGGALLTTLFWLTFAFGRLIAIPLSIYIPPKIMISVDLVGTTIFTILMWVNSSSLVGLGICLVFYGLFMASTFPTAITLLQTIMPVTGKMTTIFVVGASLGEMLVPLLVSSNFPSTNYMSLVYVQFASVASGTLVMIGVGFLGHLIMKQREIKKQLESKIHELEAMESGDTAQNGTHSNGHSLSGHSNGYHPTEGRVVCDEDDNQVVQLDL